VAKLCKEIPACFPHEIYGFERDSVPGLLLSMDLISNINAEANAEMNHPTTKGKQLGRRARAQKNFNK
jgi:hypothetical protein